MEGLPSVILKSIMEVLNRLGNYEDNLFSWKLTLSQDKFSLTVSCKLPAKTPNKAKDDNKVTGCTTVKPVKRRRRKKNRSPSVLACARKRRAVPGKEVSWKTRFGFARRGPAGFRYVYVKELENTSLAYDSNQVSLENPTPSPAADPDLLKE